MRKWRCHKVVEAEEIIEIRPATMTVPPRLILRGGEEIELEKPGERDRFFPAGPWVTVGCYLVVYEDGYRSWSPAGAFEAGYTVIGADELAQLHVEGREPTALELGAEVRRQGLVGKGMSDS